MSKSAPKPCNTCSRRALTNPSGKAKCNGKSPCSWCKNKKLVCTYSSGLPIVPPSNNAPKTTDSTCPDDDTTMILTDKADGSRTIRFSPDPHNLGEVDAVAASDFCLPGDPPIDSYMALVGERKRKRIEDLIRYEVEAPTLSSAKRIRGGIGNNGEDGHQAQQVLPPPPPPPAQIDPIAQALQAIATANTTIAASNATTHQMLAQVLEHMDNNNGRRVPAHLSPASLPQRTNSHIAYSWHIIFCIANMAYLSSTITLSDPE
ncbi:hypothetical protein FRC11_011935 [Ceratobasidium sp. 423]|nr:hypothetical protein FRC11_011935 [Ceratobasidium sp. 423]